MFIAGHHMVKTLRFVRPEEILLSSVLTIHKFIPLSGFGFTVTTYQLKGTPLFVAKNLYEMFLNYHMFEYNAISFLFGSCRTSF